jgi:hypothetical protein
MNEDPGRFFISIMKNIFKFSGKYAIIVDQMRNNLPTTLIQEDDHASLCGAPDAVSATPLLSYRSIGSF